MTNHPDMSEDLVLVGRVLGPHGIGGHVKVVPEGGFEGVLEQVPLWRIGFDETSVSLQRVEEHSTHVSARGKSIIARLDGIVTRTAAERLKGASVFLARDEVDRLVAPEADTFDPVGYTVATAAGDSIGTVVEIAALPAQDLLVVRRSDGEDAMIPWVDDFVLSVDEEQHRIVMEIPDGLIG